MEIDRQIRLMCLCARNLTGLPLLLSGKTGSNRWQLDSKTEKVTTLSPGRDILTNKRIPVPKLRYIELNKTHYLKF